MPEFDFDVDASIAAGWDRFASRLAELVRLMSPGATFDLTVPVLGVAATRTPYICFSTPESGWVHAVVTCGASDDSPAPLHPSELEHLTALGWVPDHPAVTESTHSAPGVRVPVNRASQLAHLIAETMERVFAIPHPVFLHDVVDCDDPDATAAPSDDPAADDADFRSQPITDPDQATLAVGNALTEMYRRRVRADEHGVFTVPAGSVLLFVRAHRSLPLIVFRSPLVSKVEDAAAAETEVAILNRDSLWCRYVFDGTTITAEAEFVDRVFVPINFKIHFTEISAELDDVYPDLARRVAGKQWRDLHTTDDPESDEQ